MGLNFIRFTNFRLPLNTNKQHLTDVNRYSVSLLEALTTAKKDDTSNILVYIIQPTVLNVFCYV